MPVRPEVPAGSNQRGQLTDAPTVSAQISRVAEDWPDRPAVRSAGRQLSYRELELTSRALAGRLAAAGAGPGSVVAVSCPDRLDQLLHLLAVWHCGATYLAIDPAAPAERTAFQLADTGAMLTLTGAREELPAATAAVVGSTPAQLAYLLQTSGTTGVPKAVAVEHHALAAHIVAIRDRFGLRAEDVVLQLARPTVDVAIEQIAATLTTGACLLLPPAGLLSAAEFLQLLDAEQVTVANVAAGYFADVVATLRTGRPAPARLRTMISGSDRLFPAAARDWLERTGITLFNAYGPTETVITAAVHQVSGELSDTVPIGDPVAGRHCYLLDDRLAPVPDGEPGQLYLGGTVLATGYLNRPGLTAQRFLPDPFAAGGRMYRTGDLVRRGPGGALEFLGRTDGQVKIRGFRVELGEVESALAAHPAVAAAAVTTHGSDQDGHRLAGYLVAAGRVPDYPELYGFLTRTLPEHMIPATITVLPALPTTPSGKVDRSALPVPSAPVSASAPLAPRTPTEQLLAGIWADVLGVPQVGLGDNFFHLGGDSLTAVRVAGRVFELFGPVSPYLIFDAPTLAEFAVALRGQLTGESVPGPVRRSASSAPLSPFQQGLWLLDCLQPGTSVYNVPWLFEFTGPIEAGTLGRALNLLVERHEALRSTFAMVAGQPQQQVLEQLALSLPVTDLTAVTPAEQQARRDDLIRAATERSFDLTTGPLLRAELIRTGPVSTLVLVLHHLVWDEGSLAVLDRELRECYEALTEERAPRLPELAVQYADYAAWLTDRADEIAADPLAYWADQLRGAATRPAVVADRPRQPVPSQRSGYTRFAFDPELASSVREFARACDVTPFMLLLAGLVLAVHRREGADDLTVGTPVSVRDRPELDALIGYFINVLPLRFRLDPDASLRDLLDSVRAVALGGYEHQQVPLEQITGRVLSERSSERHQLFQLVFEMHTADARPLPVAGARLSRQLHVNELSRFDLSWSVADDGTGFAGRIEYDTDLFDAATAVELGQQWLAAVTDLVTDAEQPVRGRAPAPDPLALAPSPDRFRPVHQLFEEQARLRPRATALIAGDGEPEVLSYGELNARANRVARWLIEHGAGAGDVIGVEVPRGIDLVVGLLGALKCGAGYTLLDPDLPAPRRAAAIADAGVRLVVTGSEIAAAAAGSGDGQDLELPAGPDLVACVMFTSGSTGRPKGVLATHRALTATYLGQDYADFGPAAVWLQCSPVSWDAFGLELYGALLFGGVCVLQPGQRPEPDRMTRLAARYGVTHLQLSASLFNLLVDEFPSMFEGLHIVFTGGERASVTHVARLRQLFPQLRIGNGYGPVESMGFTTCHRIGDADLTAAAIPIGTAIAAKRVYVLDERFGPAGTGEIFTAGDGLALGYLGQPGLTAERFLPDPFGAPGSRMYRTSDLGGRNADGTLAITGRADDQAKIRGFRVEPGEVAAMLNRHPGVADCAVVVHEPVAGSPQLAAYLTSTLDPPPSYEQVYDHLAAVLPDYMIPASVTVLPAIPLTGNGKLDRSRLPVPAPIEAAPGGTLTGDAERLVAEVWAEVLGVAPTGGQDNFFRLGGNSLAAVRVALVLSERLGRRVAPQVVFATRTVSGLARRLPALLPSGRA